MAAPRNDPAPARSWSRSTGNVAHERLATLAAIALTFLVRGARADAPPVTGPVELEWDAPPECPSGASVEAEVVRLSKAARSTERWHARASVVRGGEREWRLHLSTEFHGQTDARDFTAPSCTELASVAAVVLAVAVDPAHAPPATPVEHDATFIPAVVVHAEPPPAPPPPPASLRLPPLAVYLDARLSLGVTATPAFGVDVGLAWTPKHARVELEGRWLPSAEVRGTVAGTGGSFELDAGALAGCWLPVDGAVRLGGCAGLELGVVRADGTGAGVAPLPKTASWVAAEAGSLLVWTVASHVGIRVRADLLAPIVRNSFVISDAGLVHQASPVGGEGSLGVEAQFP